MRKILFTILGILFLFPLMGRDKCINRVNDYDDFALMNELKNAGYIILPEVVITAYRNSQDTIKPMERGNIMARKHYRGQMVNDTVKFYGRNGNNFQKQMYRRPATQPKRPVCYQMCKRK